MKKYIALLGVFFATILALVIFDKVNNPYQGNPIKEEVSETFVAPGENVGVEEKSVVVHDVTEIQPKEEVIPETEVSVDMDAILYDADWESRKAYGLTAENLPLVMQQMEGRYVYDVMRADLHQLYAEIYLILTQQATEIALCSVNEEDIDYAYSCVMADHPEIFYSQGFIYTRHISNETIRKITFSGNYTHTQPEIVILQAEIDKATQQCLSGISASAGEYDKVKYVYDYIIQNTEYDLESKENQNICSVLVYGYSVCQGYAKTLQYLLERLGVNTILVTGTVGSDGHAWNMVSIDGAYYLVDATWGDASYLTDLQSEAIVTVNYDYFCITTAEMGITHVEDNVVPVPQCVATEANYYVKEGLFFTEMNEQQLDAAFQKAYAQGSESVMIKCADLFVYQNMKQSMLEEQKIFDYLSNTVDELSYSENETLYTFTFLLQE